MLEVSRLSAARLRQLARGVGAGVTGTKKTVADAVRAACARPQGPLRLLSLDLGLRNFGICEMLSFPGHRARVVSLQRSNVVAADAVLGGPVREFSHQVVQFMEPLLACGPDAVVMEHQFTGAQGRWVPRQRLMLHIFEGILYGLLAAKYPSVYTESINPKRVMELWTPLAASLGYTRGSATYSSSKKLRLRLVETWLSRPEIAPFELDPSVAIPGGKMDDASDALVQGLTWLLWRENARRIEQSKGQVTLLTPTGEEILACKTAKS